MTKELTPSLDKRINEALSLIKNSYHDFGNRTRYQMLSFLSSGNINLARSSAVASAWPTLPKFDEELLDEEKP